MKNLKNLHLSWSAAILLLVLPGGMTGARADSPSDTLITPNSSLLKGGNWNGTSTFPGAGSIGSISQAGSTGPVGWNNNTNPGSTTFGAIDVVSGATNLVIGDYTTKSSNINVDITLSPATLNNIANTVMANSSGSTVLFQNDIVPSGDDATEAGLTTYTLNSGTNVIQATTTSNIIIDNVVTGIGANVTFMGGGSSSTTGATLELGAGSVNDVAGGAAANAPVKANTGFSGAGTQQTSDKNGFTGGLTVGNSDGTQAGVVKIDGANALPTTGTVTVNTNNQLLLNGSASNYGGTGQTVTLNGTGTGGANNGALTTGSGDTSTLQTTLSLPTASSVNVQGSAGTLNLTGQVTGGGQLQSVGTGTLTLSHANNYSGGTLVKAGALVAANSTALGTGNVTVSGGNLSSTVTTASIGGNLSLTSGSITLNASAAPTLQLALDSTLDMSGGTLSLTFNSGNIGSIQSLGGTSSFDITAGTLNLNNSITNYSATYDVLNDFGSGSVSGLTITNYDTADYTANLGANGELSFSSTAAPEPSTYAMMIGGFALLIGFQSLRNRGRRTGLLGLALAICLAGATRANAQIFTDGDIVVTVYGNAGNAATNSDYLDGQATPITLEEFSSAIVAPDTATPVLVDTLPTTGTGANVGIIGEYGSSSEGTIQLSGNGEYLTIGGYDGNLDERGAPSGGYGGSNTAEAQSTDTDVPRVAAEINVATGSVDTSTVLNDVYSTNNPRSVYSPDGTNLYISGQGPGKSDEGGIYSTKVGTNTTSGGSSPTPIFNTVSTRTVTQANVNAANGTSSSTPNTYYSADQNSSSKGTQTGIFEYAGSPSSSQGSNTGIRITPATLTFGSTTLNFSPQGFYFANATTLYVADTGDPKDGGQGDGGIQKWSYAGPNQTWTLDYTLTYNFAPTSTESGFSSLTGEVVNGVVDLYATSYTTTDDAPDGLYAVADTLSDTTATQAAGESIVQLAASTPDMDFKGVALIPAAVPEPSTTSMLILTLLSGAAFAWKNKRMLKV